MSLLDWQFTRFSSPVFDLFDILLATSDKEFRDKSYQNVIKHYYESLSAAIKRLGSDPANLFTFGDLQNQLIKFGKYGFYIGTAAIIAILPDDCIPSSGELSKAAPTGDSKANETFAQYDEKTEALLRTRMNDLFTDLLSWGYYTN